MISVQSHFGSYALSFGQEGDLGDGLFSYIQQSVDLTDVDELTFYDSWNLTDAESEINHDVLVKIDSVLIQQINHDYGTSSSWVKRTVDVSSYTGTKTVRIEVYQQIPGDATIGSVRTYIDDVSAVSS